MKFMCDTSGVRLVQQSNALQNAQKTYPLVCLGSSATYGAVLAHLQTWYNYFHVQRVQSHVARGRSVGHRSLPHQFALVLSGLL